MARATPLETNSSLCVSGTQLLQSRVWSHGYRACRVASTVQKDVWGNRFLVQGHVGSSGVVFMGEFGWQRGENKNGRVAF